MSGYVHPIYPAPTTQHVSEAHRYLNSSVPFDESFWAAFFGIIILVALVAIVISLGWYVFRSISLYKIAKTNEVKNPWIAFIPLVYVFTFGELTQKKSGIKNLATTLLTLAIVSQVLSFIFNFADALSDEVQEMTIFSSGFGFLSFIATVAYFVVLIFAGHSLFKMYHSANAVLLTVLNILTGGFLVSTIVMFINRNKKYEEIVILPEAVTNEEPVQEKVQEKVQEENLQESEQVVEEVTSEKDEEVSLTKKEEE